MDAKLNPQASCPALPTVRRASVPWLHRWADWLRHLPRVASHNELRGMSDRELQDLGIGRSEIPHLLGRQEGRPRIPAAG